MKIIWGSLIIFLLHTPVQAVDKIRVAMPGGTHFMSLALAQKTGLLKEEGLDAEFIVMRGNVPMAALVNGDIDFAISISRGGRSSDPAFAGEACRVLCAWGCPCASGAARS